MYFGIQLKNILLLNDPSLFCLMSNTFSINLDIVIEKEKVVFPNILIINLNTVFKLVIIGCQV